MEEKRYIRLPSMNPAEVADEIGTFILSQTDKFMKTGGVIGLSGGVDSTTAAALAKRAYDKAEGRELVGYILPSRINSPEDAKDGEYVAKKLGIRYEVIDIEPIAEAFRHSNPEAFNNKYDRGNLLSRIRANILSTKAASENKLVIGTGNKDEDFGIGYYTLFGDGAVHMSPIGSLSKRLVRDMARHLGFPELANRVPTAGLEPGQTDFKDLGYQYDLVEIVSEGIAQGLSRSDIINGLQVISSAQRSMREYETLYGKSKWQGVTQMVDDIYARHEGAIEKGKLISPPIAKVTLDYGL